MAWGDYSVFLIGLVAFLGVFAGELLAWISPEEMKPGKKYFIFFEAFFLVIICLLALVLVRINIYLFFIGIVLGFLLRKEYAYFAGILFGLNAGLLFLFSSLVFIYGLFYGTLYTPLKEWKWLKLKWLVLDAVLFFAVGFLVWYFHLEISSLCAGGLVSLVYFKVREYKKLNKR